MKIQLHFDGITLTDTERDEVTEKLEALERFISGSSTILDAYFIDEAGKKAKNGADQAVHFGLILGKEKIFIAEVSNNHMKAFTLAYHRLKQAVEKFHERESDISHNEQ